MHRERWETHDGSRSDFLLTTLNADGHSDSVMEADSNPVLAEVEFRTVCLEVAPMWLVCIGGSARVSFNIAKTKSRGSSLADGFRLDVVVPITAITVANGSSNV